MIEKNKKLIVVLGPTSSGKSDLAVIIAKKYNGEVVSADSRQVYKGMDIGTGKVTKKEKCNIPHYLLDVANPRKKYSVSQFKKAADKAINKIVKQGKVPILCGGTGFYIQAIVDNFVLPEVKPNNKLRKELSKLSTTELYSKLSNLDNVRAKNIDRHNPHRLIRAIEIAQELGKVPELHRVPKTDFDILQLGISLPKEVLEDRITKRLDKRLRRGMVAEIKHLHSEGLSYKRMIELGLEYKFISLFLSSKLTNQEAISQLTTASFQYAKRQMTWFKRDKRIKWIKLEDTKKTLKLIENFLSE